MTNELQTLDVHIAVQPKVATTSRWLRQQPFLFVVADGHDLAPRALGEVANSDFHASISIFHLTL
jgi:hypothetical protein